MKLPEMKVGVGKAGQTLYTITPEEFQAAIEKDGEMYQATTSSASASSRNKSSDFIAAKRPGLAPGLFLLAIGVSFGAYRSRD